MVASYEQLARRARPLGPGLRRHVDPDLLTRLGAPVAQLIDNIAAGLHSTAASASGAKVAAGAILFGYTITGILVGYVMTTLWYQRKITNQQTPITLT